MAVARFADHRRVATFRSSEGLPYSTQPSKTTRFQAKIRHLRRLALAKLGGKNYISGPNYARWTLRRIPRNPTGEWLGDLPMIPLNDLRPILLIVPTCESALLSCDLF